MRLRDVPLLTLTLLLLATEPARTAVPVSSGPTSALVIAGQLRAHLETVPDTQDLRVEGVRLHHPAALSAFYRARSYAPVWAPHAGPGGADLEELQGALAAGRDHGLPPEFYHADLIRQLQDLAERAADLELIATDAFLTQGLHRAHGRLQPAQVDPEWHLFTEEMAPAALLEQLAEGPPVSFVLDSLWPRAREYWQLLEEKRRLLATVATPPDVPTVTPGPLLRPGVQGVRVNELRARLGLPAHADARFDTELETVVRGFQAQHGLAADGIVGPQTLELLNLSDADRIQRIDVNMERWRWLMQTLPATHVQVNVADFTLRVVEDAYEVLRMNVIVGTPFRRTPVFTELMRYLVLNPDWSVPRRIAVQDKLPLLRKDAAALAAQGYEARLANSPEPMQPVDAFDWSSVTARNFNYLLRQRPGQYNALGQVKFILPNPYAVYLHDTPTRELFARSGRAFSSGCIRLEHAMVLAEWVLRDQPQWTRARMDQVLARGATVNVLLREPLPVLILYFTVIAGESGTIYYRPDLYGRDAPIAAALAREVNQPGFAAR